MVISPTEVEVSWLEVDPIHRNGIIIVHEVDYQPMNDFGSEDVTRVNTTNTTIVLMDLHESVQYTITVRAFTSVGGGPFNNPVASVTHEDGIYNYKLCKLTCNLIFHKYVIQLLPVHLLILKLSASLLLRLWCLGVLSLL